jgi:hypothetical protein
MITKLKIFLKQNGKLNNMTKFVFTLNQTPLDFAEDVYLEIVSLAKQNKEFQVEIKPLKNAKTYKQLKGIHKLCEIYGNYMSESEGQVFSFENAKERLKYEIGFTRLANYDEALAIALREKDFLNKNFFLNIQFANLVNILQKNYQVPKSFAEASLEEMMLLIEKIHELGRDRGWHNLVLTSEETDQMIKYYNDK